MAATIARATGYDNTRHKVTHRLANIWHTFAEACVSRDGSGYIRVTRGGKVLHNFSFDAE